MTREELLACLHRHPEFDAAVERIGEADYGCEELPAGADAPAWVLLLLQNGTEKSMEVPESRLASLHLEEGSLFTLSMLNP